MSRCAVGPQQPLAVEGNVHIAHEVSSKVINVWLLLSYLLWILLYERVNVACSEKVLS